jgi:hypothetical protein
MAGCTFYGCANSADVGGVDIGTAQGGLVFLYSFTIACSWSILLLLLQLLDDKNIVIAGKFPFTLIVTLLLMVIFLCVSIASIIAAGAVLVPAGQLIGYFILTWVLTELVQLCVVFVQFKFGKPPRSGGFLPNIHDGEDEYAENRGTFQGVDEDTAVTPIASAESTQQTDGDDFNSLLEEGENEAAAAGEDDLGLL